MIPTPEMFTHRSHVHGQAHVARVMVHAMRLVEATGRRDLAVQVWGAVYLHDVARTHDGACAWHGMDAIRKWRESAVLRRVLGERGLEWHRERGVHQAVILHCQSPSLEPGPGHPDHALVALVKDADALDRVRLGDLNVDMLRFPEARAMVGFAQALHDTTTRRIPVGESHFADLLPVAERLAGGPIAPLV